MGVIKQGILGGISGKVGTVVGGTWKGIDYLRARPQKVANPNTEKQQNQRTKFSTVLGFLKPFTGFLAVGFKSLSVGQTGFNAAMSYNVKNAVTGIFPNFVMDFPSTLLSSGKATGAMNPSVASAAPGSIQFGWADNTGIGNAKTDDVAVLATFFEGSSEAVYQFTNIQRNALVAELIVPDVYSGQVAQCWLCFQTADGKDISNSLYIGTVNVA
jgi:hypothetical protein